MLHSKICEMFGIEVPIVLAGMGEASTPALAAAVSEAGGLGVLGAAACGPAKLRRWIHEVRSLTDRPFGVDTLLPASVRREPGGNATASRVDLEAHRAFSAEFMKRESLEPNVPSGDALERAERRGEPRLFTREFFEAQMEVVIEEEVPVYAAGLGDPGPYVERLHAAGTKVLSVVGAVRHARKVASSGVDAVVAQGHDGGGHNASVGTLALIPQVRDALGDLPLLAAGGITDGRGVAAALMLGAAGAWVGTAFLATDEAGLPPYKKKALVEAGDQSTVVSRSVTGKPARLLRTRWTDAWEEASIKPLPMPYQSVIAGPVLASGEAAERPDIDAGFAGQGLGLVHAVRPAAEVLREIVAQAEDALRSGERFLRA